MSSPTFGGPKTSGQLAMLADHPVALYFHRLGSAGGAERMICVLANALCERGFSVHLITWDRPDTHSFFALDPRVVWSRLDFRPGTKDKLRRTHALARLLHSRNIRILVGFVMSGDKTVYAAAKLAGVRLVVAERSAPTMYHLKCSFVQRWICFGMLHLADRITVQMADFIIGYPASLRNRIEVIPNPVPVAERRASPDRAGTDGRFNLLTVGRLDGVEKRFECLVSAFARIAGEQSAWDLYIVGDGCRREMLRGLAAREGVEGRVRWESWASDVSGAYAGSHLFVIPSLWEGFPNALAEAMSHGLPAVGFRDAAGVAQLITDGETGWLADGLDDEAALARAMLAAMADGTERARRGARAAESMASYGPEAQLDRWARLLGFLMDKPIP
jgi:GalNAc-alpha-(1->4)-GalNAc-alpha-(1->3)-diNAcBac-PP-undecaprenol alpha-1,4-N-acetyl-D-galactosaminyltransferase